MYNIDYEFTAYTKSEAAEKAVLNTHHSKFGKYISVIEKGGDITKDLWIFGTEKIIKKHNLPYHLIEATK